MTKDKALELAQELKELANRFSEGWHDGIKIDASDIMLLSTAAEAIEQAQKQEPVAWNQGVPSLYPQPQEGVSIVVKEHAQKQEPVAWMFQHEETGRMNYVSNDGMNTPELFLKMNPRYVFVCALYTSPPQRQWVELTNNDWNSTPYDTEFRAGAEWAEAILKDKNT